MADHDSDIPQDADQGAVPNPHRGEPLPVEDQHTRSAPDAEVTRPDQEEELGPIEGLMHAATTEATTEVTDDPSAEAEADRMGIEAEGIESAQIFSIFMATIVTLVLAVVGVFWLVAFYTGEEQVERDGESVYIEIQESDNRATELLTQYGRTEDIYRMPIDDAITLVAADYAGHQGTDVTPAPINYRTVYLSDYFDDSGFEPPVPGTAQETMPLVEDGETLPAEEPDLEPDES